MPLRPYQQDAVESAMRHMQRSANVNGCVVIPTGGGKTHVMGDITQRVVANGGRVLLLAHTQELVGQNAKKLEDYCGKENVGIYSASFKKRDTDKLATSAQIQSVYNKDLFTDIDLAIVDEAHLIRTDGEGMYNTLFDTLLKHNPDMRVLGMTATPYRLSGGIICHPTAMLNKIVYEIGVDTLIKQGYLCPITLRGSRYEVNTAGIKKTGGDFNVKELASVWEGDNAENEANAVNEIIQLTQDRNSVLIFCINLAHMDRVKSMLHKAGHDALCVDGNTDQMFREQHLEDFKEDRVKFMLNVGVLTTGFDAPNIDCVVLLRPTASEGLYYQMIGRAFRLHPSKENALILDYGGNVKRLGPIDKLQKRVERRGKKGKQDKKEVDEHWQCPDCNTYNERLVKTCENCGYEKPAPKVDHDANADQSSSLLSSPPVEVMHTVAKMTLTDYTSNRSGKRMLKVDYYTAKSFYPVVSEYVCMLHPKGSYPYRKAVEWWKEHEQDGHDMPDTVEAVLAIQDTLLTPETICVKDNDNGFANITSKFFPMGEQVELTQAEIDDLPF